MATILELAAYAEVSAEHVLRVINGEPVSEDVERRVRGAIEVLGRPSYPPGPQVLPALAPGSPGELADPARAESLAELGALFDRLLARLEDVAESVEDERRGRLEDVALLTELLTSGWRSVDRRLARLEQVVARIEAGRNWRRESRLYRLDDPPARAPAESGTGAALGDQ